jgi:mono/diheme cytochrome c family protein
MMRFVTSFSQQGVNIAGVLLVVVVCAVWSWQGSLFAPPQDVEIDIPRGTAEQIAQGADISVIPELITLREGDSIVLINRDIEGHRVGGLYASANSTVTARFSEAGSYSYLCSVHPSGQTVFEVTEAPSVMPMAWSLLAMIGVLGVINGFYLGGFSVLEAAGMIVIGGAVMLGAVAVLAGMVISLTNSNPPVDESALGNNPIPPSAASIANGKATYLQFCSTCHGESTLGDGPLAVGLDPPPANLVVHVPLHPDNVLYQFVQKGIPGSSMPPLEAAISDDETWDLVNYLRTIE